MCVQAQRLTKISDHFGVGVALMPASRMARAASGQGEASFIKGGMIRYQYLGARYDYNIENFTYYVQ